MATDSVEMEKVVLAISDWMREHFKGFKPNIQMFATQLIEDKGIHSVNRFNELVESGEAAQYAESFFGGLLSTLGSISTNKGLKNEEL
jgi:hypothetical protein